jgi:hypothetical protein
MIAPRQTLEWDSLLMRRTIFFCFVAWVVAISLLHGVMNLGLLDHSRARGSGGPPFRVGFLPVT